MTRRFRYRAADMPAPAFADWALQLALLIALAVAASALCAASPWLWPWLLGVP